MQAVDPQPRRPFGRPPGLRLQPQQKQPSLFCRNRIYNEVYNLYLYEVYNFVVIMKFITAAFLVFIMKSVCLSSLGM